MNDPLVKSDTRPPQATSVALTVALLLGVVVASVGVSSIGSAGSESSPASAPRMALGASGVAGLTLALAPSPQSGPAPLSVNVTAAISGGAPPYTLTLCYGAADHTSPNGDCQPAMSGWTGTSPIVRNHVFASVGNFSVLGLANDSAGESVGSTALVVVTSAVPLIVSAVEQTTAGTAPLSVTFNESVSGSSLPVSLEWVFGDGSSEPGAPGLAVTHVYTSFGTFEPMLDVRDAAGHQTDQSLPAITVNRAASSSTGIVPGLSPLAGIELVTAFAVAAVITGSAVTLVRRRRWRREGDELVDWLRESERTPNAPPRPP